MESRTKPRGTVQNRAVNQVTIMSNSGKTKALSYQYRLVFSIDNEIIAELLAGTKPDVAR